MRVSRINDDMQAVSLIIKARTEGLPLGYTIEKLSVDTGIAVNTLQKFFSLSPKALMPSVITYNLIASLFGWPFYVKGCKLSDTKGPDTMPENFTPAPWHHDTNAEIISHPGSSDPVAILPTWNDEDTRKGNAALIANAPAMYSLLKFIRDDQVKAKPENILSFYKVVITDLLNIIDAPTEVIS